MPKLPLINIRDFSGGIANNIPLYKMRPNQFTELEGMGYDKARAKLVAKFMAQVFSTNITKSGEDDLKFVAGFYTEDDKFWWLCIYDDNTNYRAMLFEHGSGEATGSPFSLGTNSSWDTISVYYENGVLRICGSHTLDIVKFSYLWSSKTLFENITLSAGWHMINTDLDLENTPVVYVNGASSNEISLYLSQVAGSSNYTTDDSVAYGVSIELDDGQESKLVTNETIGLDIMINGNYVELFVTIDTDTIETNFHNMRYLNIYRSISGSDFYLWKKCDVASRTACYDDNDTERQWSDSSNYSSVTLHDYGNVLSDSYESLTGYYGSIKKTKGTTSETVLDNGTEWCKLAKVGSIILDRGVLGNVKINGTVYNDRVMVSPRGKYDSFPEDRYFSVGIGDGDTITCVKQFGKYMMAVFKKRHLYVIDMSSPSEASWTIIKSFDEGTEWPNAVRECDYGLLFCNERDAFLLQSDLEIIRLTSQYDWNSEYNGQSDIWGVYDRDFNEYIVDYQDGDARAITLDSRMVTSRGYRNTADEKLFLCYGPIGNEICVGIKDTTGSDDFVVYHLTGANIIRIPTSLKTAPIYANEYKDRFKMLKLYLTYKTATGYSPQYGISEDMNTEPTASIALDSHNTTAKTSEIRHFTTTNCIRLALSSIDELHEIALEVLPLPSRSIEAID